MELEMLAPIAWGALIASAWLAYKAYRVSGCHTQINKMRLFALVAATIVVTVLAPTVWAIWTIIGDFPVGTCPNCSLLDKAAILAALVPTVLLIMSPAGLLIWFMVFEDGTGPGCGSASS